MNLIGHFRSLHRPGTPLLIPNPWDAGSARLLESLGFQALATTSSGFAATLGRLDGNVTRREAIEHAGAVAAAVSIPVSADLENGFGHAPADVAETIKAARAVGLAGGSIEDYSPDGVYPIGHATERVRAAVEAAAGELVITARAENHIRVANPDLADTIARLTAYQEAGADVLYAPGLTSIEDIRAVVNAVDRPVNVLALRGVPAVAELAQAGVARISVGGGFSNVVWGALLNAARELLDEGTYRWMELAGEGRAASRAAFH